MGLDPRIHGFCALLSPGTRTDGSKQELLKGPHTGWEGQMQGVCAMWLLQPGEAGMPGSRQVQVWDPQRPTLTVANSGGKVLTVGGVGPPGA